MDHRKTDKIRVDQLLGQSCGLTRREAQRAIRAGELRINGAVVTHPGARVGIDDGIELGQSTVSWPSARYFMLNKPAGVVCATRDDSHRTVLDLLDVDRRNSLRVAGRLDVDTTGLVLITDDGEWLHRVTAPRYKVPRTYIATLAEPLAAPACKLLLDGVTLNGETGIFAARSLECLPGADAKITVAEGKYHQVKRMFAAVGNHVVSLHRESIGPLMLDADMKEGAFRPLTSAEVRAVIGERAGPIP